MSNSNDDPSNNSNSSNTNEPGVVVARIVRCPTCGKSSEYSPRNLFRPFCSERCRTNDLGAWAEGRYAIPAEKINADDFSSDDDADPSGRHETQDQGGSQDD